MKSHKMMVAFLATLALTVTTGFASVTAAWDDGISVTNGSFVGTKYTLSLTSDQGPIYAVDMKIVSANATPGHAFYNEQYREGRIFKSGPAASYDVDSLFLFYSSGLTLSKNGESDTIPSDDEWLFTSDLYASWSFTNGVGSFTSAPVAQIILPFGEAAPTLDMLFNTNDSLHQAYVVTNNGTGDVKVAITSIPEPLTMSLLGVGALAILRRRSR